MKRKTKNAKREPLDLYSYNVCAPDWFQSSQCPPAEWRERVGAFVDAMDALGRVVIIQRELDSGALYLSSIEQVQPGGPDARP